MINEAEFRIVGRVGRVTQVGKATKVSICANYSYRQDDGTYAEQPHWNTITVFPQGMQDYIGKHVEVGDLVMTTGRLREASYEKDGATVYTVDLIASRFGRLAGKQAAGSQEDVAS